MIFDTTAPTFINFRTFYDGKFGEGRYASKFGSIEEPETNAAPWNWESYKHKV